MCELILLNKYREFIDLKLEDTTLVGISKILKSPEGLENLFIFFKGFDSNSSAARDYCSQIYLWASYELYPKRVYVSSDQKSRHNNILISNDLPNDAWLKATKINTVLTIEYLGKDAKSPTKYSYKKVE